MTSALSRCRGWDGVPGGESMSPSVEEEEEEKESDRSSQALSS